LSILAHRPDAPCSVSLLLMMYESRLAQSLARFHPIVNGSVSPCGTPPSALTSRSIFHAGDRG
jgi:hypothetical protein